MRTLDPKALPPEQRADLLVRRVAGFFAALLVGPGAGQLAMGHRLRAFVWFVVGALTVLPGPLFSVWAFYANLPLRVASGVDTLLLRPPEKGMPRWLAVVGFWAGLMALSFGLRAVTPSFYRVLIAHNVAMEPNVERGEQVMVVTGGYEPSRGDAVAIVEPKDKRLRLTRIIGMKGDRVKVWPDGTVAINGRRLAQKVLPGPCSYLLPQGAGQSRPLGSNEPLPPPKKKLCRLVAERHGVLVRKILLPPMSAKSVESAPRSVATSQPASQPSTRPHAMARPASQPVAATSRPVATASQPKSLLVPEGHLFVWGDNRAEAPGSQRLGLVPLDNLLGQIRSIWWSASEQGLRWGRVGAAIQ